MSTDHGPGPATPAEDQPQISVIAVTYNPGPTLADFSASLATATTRPYELLLADNGSADGAPQALAATGAAKLLPTGGNRGYGGAANHGAKAAAASSAWVVVANPDVTWHPGALDAMVDAAARWPRGGAFGPAIRDDDGTLYPSARELPSLRFGVGHALLARVWPTNPWSTGYHRRQETTDASTERTAGWLSGSCLLLRREAFEAVGGFDESYFMFFEDTDLGQRLGQAGWASVYVPSATVTHVGGASWKERPEPMIRAHHRSAYQYLSRRYARWWQWPLRAALRVGLAVRCRVELRRAQQG